MSKSIVLREQRTQLSSVRKFDEWYVPHVEGVLMSWRQRHPLIHMVEPLSASMHTAAGWQPTVIHEHERDKQERLAGTDALMPS